MTKTSQVLDNTTVDLGDGSAGQIAITSPEAAVFFGTSYYFSAIAQGIPNATDKDYLLRFVAPQTEIQPTIFFNGTGVASVFGGPTVTDDGTPELLFARNRIGPVPAVNQMFADPTITDDGLPLGDYLILGDSGKNSPPSVTAFPLPWVIGPSDVLVRVTNTSGGARDLNFVGTLIERF